jgi:hypothetical protein
MNLTGQEFLATDDPGFIFEIVNDLQRKYLAAGYMGIPSVDEVSERMEELILAEGYAEISVETIFFESAQILGMKMKK